MTATDLITLTPVFHRKMWGGQKLRTDFHFPIKPEPTGEAWTIGAHPNGDCVIKAGPGVGQTLSQLYQQQPELFGNPTETTFPLLVKILDANQQLSVQVHPDDSYAYEHAHERGKTECWYILSAEPNSYLIYGHTAQTKTDLETMVNHQQWAALLKKRYVKTGDFVYVPSGTLHAIGPGVVVLEIQQSSDTTYRFYDFDRVDPATGTTRELHIADSLACTTVPHHDPVLPDPVHHPGKSETLLNESNFHVIRWQVDHETITAHHHGAPYTLLSVIDGTGTIIIGHETTPITKGDSFIVPATIDEWQFSGNLTIVGAEPTIK